MVKQDLLSEKEPVQAQEVKENEKEAKPRRRRKSRRTIFGTRNPLRLENKELDYEKYTYRWPKDYDPNGRRIQELIEDDYELVNLKDAYQSSDQNVNAPKQMGSVVVRPAGRDDAGVPQYHYLMRKLKEWDEEDYAEKMKEHEMKKASLSMQSQAESSGHANIYIPSREK